MPSSYKTTHLRLNQWIGSDIPKRTDFNSDNIMVEEICGSHINNAQIHITQDERSKWNAPFVTGKYNGSGQVERTISLGFTPAFVQVFAANKPTGADSASDCYSAMASAAVGSVGIQIVSGGITVQTGSVNAVGGYVPKLNAAGVEYAYIAYK
jgi:hypothetical protein